MHAPTGIYFLALLAPLAAATLALPPQLFSNLIPQKVLATYKSLPSPVQYPQYTDTSVGHWLDFSPDTWTSGFFPTTLYALNTRKSICGATAVNGLTAADWLTLGRSASTGEIPLELHNNQGHDVGFLSFPFVEELAVNPNNQTALTAVKQFAADLAARFNPVVGCTRSWDTADPTDFTVIIDNMMNLEVLWVAYGLTGNETLRDIAIAHADTTMKNHIRTDGSTWHVVEYNSTTGVVIRKRTSQGFSDNSTWSRGQAWGTYGYANMYQHTNNPDYLTTARRLATYFLNNLPSTGIVPWDFNAPQPRPADTSAATIMVNGLLLLGQLDPTPAGQNWTAAALNLLNTTTALAWKPSWQSLLSNGTVNLPANNFLTGIVYGDYYYIRAGNQLVTMGLAECE
ncbi:glycoside hydrolase family 88 protein [Mycena pura]|uniref:Glycoside hydrolase family 88 protein n=1 Tax=Mycena pura TaxID=153505 RepID=A0AAD6VXF1_9AGAR|nr:glycoside hydrolase family 88 protein [Mycena pura]